MEKIHKLQSIFLVLVGVGALFGGILAIRDPYGSLYGMSPELLKKGPFMSFLIPGMFLFVVIGLGHLVAFMLHRKNIYFHPYASGIVGVILMVWIIIQCYILQSIIILHVLFFLIGFAECLMAAIVLIKENLFPYPQIRQLFK